MKSKDVMYLLLALVIFSVAGFIGYSQLVPKKSASGGVQVQVVGVIPQSLDEAGLNALSDTNKVRDYNSAVDFTGLGNANIFGP